MLSTFPIAGSARQGGMSLVEIMVALALGAFITVGIIQMFTANRATYQVNMGQARLQENARFAMDFLSEPVRMAGYSGCSSRPQETHNVVETSDGQPVEDVGFTDAIGGHRNNGGTWSPSLGSLATQLPVDRIPDGTDILSLRAAFGGGLGYHGDTAPPAATSFSDLPMDCDTQAGSCPSYEAGDILMVSDCQSVVIFVVTSSTSQQNNDPPRLRVGHQRGTDQTMPDGRTVRNRNVPFLEQGDFGNDATVFAPETRHYFVAARSDDDPTLGLWQKRGSQAPVELVEGIENLTVLYGEDTNGDRTPNRYVRIDEVGNRENIVTVRVTITANSVRSVTDQGDGLLRREFTKTIAARNRML